MTASFGQWLKEQRKSLGLTQEELSARVNISHETVRKFEADTRRPSRQVAELLAECFHIPADELEEFLGYARGRAWPQNPTALANAPWQRTQAQKTPTNLPGSLTPLIGREEHVEQVRELLRGGTRLLTLTGPPGIGKTRLALQAARESLGEFGDGTYFVALAPVSDPDMVMPTIADTLGIRERVAGTLQSTLKSSLHGKRMLLVLDNFEQVIEAGTIFAELLAACPQLYALVTSREALDLYGERQYPVPPLDVPESGLWTMDDGRQTSRPQTDVAQFAAYSAVALFVESALRINPEFRLSVENASTVAETCAHLDGLPLAIELAAARIKLLTPQAILERLTQGQGLLNSPPATRNLPLRQQTLQNAIGWSYDLLEPGERTLFRRLGVFVGGFTPTSAEAVCNAMGDIPTETFSGLESLFDKSLLTKQPDADPETRFGMLETIREYAMARLDESGEGEGIRRNHAEYCLAMAEAARAEWFGQGKAAGQVLLEKDHNNLRSALRWALDHDKIEMAVRLSKALSRFWYERGHLVEGRRWLEESLAREKVSPKPVPLTFVAKARNDLEIFMMAQSDLASAEIFILESLPLYQALDDKDSLAVAYSNLGAIAAEKEDYPGALQHFEQSLAMWRELNKVPNVAVMLANMGYLAIHMGDYPRAIALCEESLQIQRDLNETWGAVAALIKLGLALLHNGEHERAIAPLEEGLSIGREGGDKRHLAQALNYLGLAALDDGDYTQAAQFYKESLATYRDLSNAFGIMRTLTGLAGVAGAQGDVVHAIHLLAAADALTTSGTSMKLTPLEKAVRQRAGEIALTQEDEFAYNRAWEAGYTMPVEEAIALALADVRNVMSNAS
ncbi:MAG TPA: tetratricopeptide repeat protein [Chloroflexia bacterium]|nr:tetratricopeptide repeat protein [Chloroflexia bacterium]